MEGESTITDLLGRLDSEEDAEEDEGDAITESQTA